MQCFTQGICKLHCTLDKFSIGGCVLSVYCKWTMGWHGVIKHWRLCGAVQGVMFVCWWATQDQSTALHSTLTTASWPRALRMEQVTSLCCVCMYVCSNISMLWHSTSVLKCIHARDFHFLNSTNYNIIEQCFPQVKFQTGCSHEY